jgi:hypothetical protein
LTASWLSRGAVRDAPSIPEGADDPGDFMFKASDHGIENLTEADKVATALSGSVDDAILRAIQLSKSLIAVRSPSERAFFRANKLYLGAVKK